MGQKLDKHPTVNLQRFLGIFARRTGYFWHGRLDWNYHSLAGKYVREICKPLYVSNRLDESRMAWHGVDAASLTPHAVPNLDMLNTDLPFRGCSQCVGRVNSCVCDFVSVCACDLTVKEKPNLVHIYSIWQDLGMH